jgi:allantoinase
MKPLDLLIHGGSVVTPEQVFVADVGISGPEIVEMGPNLERDAAQIVDASGDFLFPGFIDAHVHFNEPGRTDWEGVSSGSFSLAAGGGTLYFDMPLNSTPPTLDGPSFLRKRQIAVTKSVTDFALWGGLTPANLATMEELADLGVIGFKAFMSDSGISDFPRADENTLKQGMKLAAGKGLPIAVHAEDQELTTKLTRSLRSAGKTGWKDYLRSRPVEAELIAIRTALELAGETGCPLHIVHVSCPEGVELITQARRKGVNVSLETCPHYLLLTERDLEQLGAPAKCAPPLRDEQRRMALWAEMQAGTIDTLGSDHSPAPPDLKISADAFSVWGGISGCQHGFVLVLAELFRAEGNDGLRRFTAMTAARVAERFHLDAKGSIAIGFPADLVLVAFGEGSEIFAESLRYRHRMSPYVGKLLRARVRRTWLRGQQIYGEGLTTEPKPMGKMVRPLVK